MDIGPSVKVKFEKVSYRQGERDFKKWFCLDIVFTDSQDRQLIKRLFEPSKDYEYRREYAYILRQLINVFEDGAWENIPRARTFPDFYTSYLKLVSKYKDKDCYIKTLPITHPVETEFVTADLSQEFISLKPMAYNTLEENQAEGYFVAKQKLENPMNKLDTSVIQRPSYSDFNNHF